MNQQSNHGVPAETQRLLEALFHGAPGTATVQIDSADDHHLACTARGTEDGRKVFKAERKFDFASQTVKHVLLVIEPDYMKAGLAGKFLENGIALYPRMGIRHIELQANIEIGGYAWARYGFKPTEMAWKALRADFAQHPIRNQMSAESLEVLDMALGMGSDGIGLVAGLEEVIKYKEAEQTVARHLLIGTSWKGVLSFEDREQMGIFRQYMERRHA